MPSTVTNANMPVVVDSHRVKKVAIPTGEMSPIIYLGSLNGAGITAVPGAGCTMRVFRSSSLPDDMIADSSGGSPTLTYANLIAGTQPALSAWELWATGAVTTLASEGPIESAGDVAIIATCTGGPGVLQVVR